MATITESDSDPLELSVRNLIEGVLTLGEREAKAVLTSVQRGLGNLSPKHQMAFRQLKAKVLEEKMKVFDVFKSSTGEEIRIPKPDSNPRFWWFDYDPYSRASDFQTPEELIAAGFNFGHWVGKDSDPTDIVDWVDINVGGYATKTAIYQFPSPATQAQSFGYYEGFGPGEFLRTETGIESDVRWGCPTITLIFRDRIENRKILCPEEKKEKIFLLILKWIAQSFKDNSSFLGVGQAGNRVVSCRGREIRHGLNIGLKYSFGFQELWLDRLLEDKESGFQIVWKPYRRDWKNLCLLTHDGRRFGNHVSTRMHDTEMGEYQSASFGTQGISLEFLKKAQPVGLGNGIFLIRGDFEPYSRPPSPPVTKTDLVVFLPWDESKWWSEYQEVVEKFGPNF